MNQRLDNKENKLDSKKVEGCLLNDKITLFSLMQIFGGEGYVQNFPQDFRDVFNNSFKEKISKSIGGG